ncbi:MAG: metalloregulator ArsR/SmtB family transcription factor [Pseudomonadales bacterium]
MSSSQDKILHQIKRLGPLTARELSEQLGVTTMAIRQHLARLEADALVESLPEESRGRGRPVRCWKLTGRGHGRFPDAHAQVTYDLITSVRNLLGETALEKLIEQRTRETLAHYQSRITRDMPLQRRLEELAELRTHEGYMAEVKNQDDGTFLLLEHHCPICIAAAACQGFCASELNVFETVFEDLAVVRRESHLLQGARRCSYRIIPRELSPG